MAGTKQLILLRHGKSSWKDPTLADIDRPLAKRGRRDAPRAGEALAAAGLVPDLVLCSPARRARETAEALVLAWHGDTHPIVIQDELYHAGPEAILEAIAGQPDAVCRLLVVGHNPELEELVRRLTNQWLPLPTAAWAAIALDIGTWQQITKAATPGRVIQVWRPREAA